MDYNFVSEGNEGLFAALLGGSVFILLILLMIMLVIGILYFIGLWKLFKKAGKNGWEAIVPFYNVYVLVEIAGLNWWYFLLAISGTIFGFLDLDNTGYISFILNTGTMFFIFWNLAKKMDKETVPTAVLGALFSPIMIMILGFSGNYSYNEKIAVSPNGPIGDNKEEKYCLGCGVKLKHDTKYCENCGKKVD